MLACLTGTVYTLQTCSITFMVVLAETDRAKDGQFEFKGAAAVGLLIGSPASLLGTIALIWWAIRLVVLYDPTKRNKYGRYIKERSVVRALCWAYVGMEVVIWTAAASYGVNR